MKNVCLLALMCRPGFVNYIVLCKVVNIVELQIITVLKSMAELRFVMTDTIAIHPIRLLFTPLSFIKS